MLGVERGLEAGSAALDLAVDQVIQHCRDQALPTIEARAACVEKVATANKTAEPVLQLMAAAIRGYWAAAAEDDKVGMARAVVALKAAAQSLPPEFFRGVQNMLGGVK